MEMDSTACGLSALTLVLVQDPEINLLHRASGAESSKYLAESYRCRGQAMRIAIDAYHALFPSGGIARYARGLIHAMATMAADNEFVLFYNLFREQGRPWRPEAANTSLCKVRFPRRVVQKAWEMLDWPPVEWLCGSIDVFHGLHFILPPTRKTRRVLTVHDLTYLKFPGYYADPKLNERGYRHELPRAIEHADAVIAVSHKTRDDLVELMGIPKERIRVIHEGVEPHFFYSPKAAGAAVKEEGEATAVRKLYGLTRPYLVFLVGSPEPRKNLRRTVEAARLGAPELPLALIGPREPLRRELGSYSESVVFTGIVHEHHLPTILAGAQISLYPSLYEGFGLPVLESMAAGAPVVASDRGSIPEVAGTAAILVDPEDVEALAHAISNLVQNEALRERLRQEGRRRAARFTWRKAAQETLALYRELL